MPKVEVSALEAGRELDVLVHERVFERSDEAPPYSTQRSVAEWLAKEYELRVIPVHGTASFRTEMDPRSEEGAVGFAALRSVPLVGDGALADGLEFFGGAGSFELAVIGAVLVIEGVGVDSRKLVRY